MAQLGLVDSMVGGFNKANGLETTLSYDHTAFDIRSTGDGILHGDRIEILAIAEHHDVVKP